MAHPPYRTCRIICHARHQSNIRSLLYRNMRPLAFRSRGGPFSHASVCSSSPQNLPCVACEGLVDGAGGPAAPRRTGAGAPPSGTTRRRRACASLGRYGPLPKTPKTLTGIQPRAPNGRWRLSRPQRPLCVFVFNIDQTCAMPLPGPIGHRRRTQRPPAARGRPPGGRGAMTMNIYSQL